MRRWRTALSWIYHQNLQHQPFAAAGEHSAEPKASPWCLLVGLFACSIWKQNLCKTSAWSSREKGAASIRWWSMINLFMVGAHQASGNHMGMGLERVASWVQVKNTARIKIWMKLMTSDWDSAYPPCRKHQELQDASCWVSTYVRILEDQGSVPYWHCSWPSMGSIIVVFILVLQWSI